jgi:hypothetical protein
VRRAPRVTNDRACAAKNFSRCTLYAEPRMAPAAGVALAEMSRFSLPFRHITKL